MILFAPYYATFKTHTYIYTIKRIHIDETILTQIW
jgi:hypothetical protein